MVTAPSGLDSFDQVGTFFWGMLPQLEMRMSSDLGIGASVVVIVISTSARRIPRYLIGRQDCGQIVCRDSRSRKLLVIVFAPK
jgi:hypothetical protein